MRTLLSAVVLLTGCGGGGGGEAALPAGVRPPLPQLVQDDNPSGERIDVSAHDFFVFASGDRAVFRTTNRFGEPLLVQREVIAGPDVQGRITVRESVPADPSIEASVERWQKTAQGLVALDYLGDGAPAGFKALVGDILMFPTPFYPAGSVRTLVRQGSLGEDLDGDGRHDSFRFELRQEFVGFSDGTRGGRAERLANFRHRLQIAIEPSREEVVPIYTVLEEDIVFAGHTGMVQARRTVAPTGTLDLAYNGVEALHSGTLGGHDINRAWNAGTTRYLTLRHFDLLYEPVRGFYYAGTSARDTLTPGAVVRIDPATGAMVASEPLGNDVRSIAVSADGSSLYAGVLSRPEIVRLSLPDLQVVQRIPLEAGTWAFSLAVSPLDPDTLAYYAEAGSLRLVRNGVVQPRSPGFFDVRAERTTNPAMFTPDGAALLMFGTGTGGGGTGLLRVPTLADGFADQAELAPGPTIGRSLSLTSAGLVAGTALHRLTDLAQIGIASDSSLANCRPLNGTPRWACTTIANDMLRIAVVDAASFQLIADGRVPIDWPPPSSHAITIVRPVPGPHGQVALMVGGESNWYGDWVALFDNPDLR